MKCQQQRLFTMKNTKLLKEPRCLWYRDRSLHFSMILMPCVSFMVDSLAWRLAMPFMGLSVQSHSSVYRRPEVPTNCETGHSSASRCD